MNLNSNEPMSFGLPVAMVPRKIAKPLNLQRLEIALDMKPFMEHAQSIISQPLSSEDEDDDDFISEKYTKISKKKEFERKIGTTKEERMEDKKHIFNFESVGPEREWLKDILLSDTDTDSIISDEDEYIRVVLKSHVKEKKHRKKFYGNVNNHQYGYYGTGLMSNEDLWPEHQKSIVGNKKRKKEREKKPKATRMTKKQSAALKLKQNNEDNSDNAENESLSIREEGDDFDTISFSSLPTKSGKGRTKKANAKTPEMMIIKRRKVWQLMAKKVVGKMQRLRMNNHKELLSNCKKVAQMCLKHGRQKAMQSQKTMKETIWRAKRLTREMQTYWKRYDRVERETKRRMEKEAEEQRKIDVEIVEAKRQQRKLNFLITQTELYAHFMSKKLGRGSEEEQLRILSQLDEETNPRLAAIDDYNCEYMKQKAQKYASEAFNIDRTRTKLFDSAVLSLQNDSLLPALPKIDATGRFVDLPQPSIFKGVLKGYQLKGMTWLANLYDQGISGILADEMGLGKTVQSIAFLCHIAETYGVYGPFLIISPASTLHNWQQEMQRFIPNFKVVPYWGSPNERKILRQFWEQKDMHTKDASFHVVITSYQLVVSDYKYFNRIKWQYMVLDEAQAIKSASSVRWKLLLGFNCRNRLLLSGTPIQNSMAELWALLHFIMPTLFDSHEEFNEWFSKDIESHAENKTGIDEKQISRLHMILKPFMLRRIKKDVENELSDKIEIMLYCPLTTRQKLLYVALRKKIRLEDLLKYTGHGSEGHSYDKNFTSNLMNLVMQFRKVCNHPELFERRDAKSPVSLKCLDYILPRLVFNECILFSTIPSKKHILYNKLSIFNSVNIHASNSDGNEKKHYEDWNTFRPFSFSRFCNLSTQEVQELALGNFIYFFKHVETISKYLTLLYHRMVWWDRISVRSENLLLEPLIQNNLNTHFLPYNSIMRDFIFTGKLNSISTVYAFCDQKILSMPETMEHRIIRSKHKNSQLQFMNEQTDETKVLTSPNKSNISPQKNVQNSTTLCPEIPYVERPIRSLACVATEMPKYLYGLAPKVQCSVRKLYCDSRAAAWTAIRHDQCDSLEGWNLVNDAVAACQPLGGWSNIIIPDKQTLVSDAGKLFVLDSLLTKLKANGHRVLIYSQMTKMIDLLEEYMWHRKHRYMRLDGSSKISARRDMVADFQNRSDIFVFLLSTRAGGLGINLTAADTVIFYDSDWNPTVDQQAMDRAHRLGQTKQVTVYRLICKNTIEQRILQRAREKSEIQRMVISGGNFKPERQDALNPNEVASLLLEDQDTKAKPSPRNEDSDSVFDKSGESYKNLKNLKGRDGRKRGGKTGNMPGSVAGTLGSVANTSTGGTAMNTSGGDGLLDAYDLRFLGSTPSSPESDTSTNMNESSYGVCETNNGSLMGDFENAIGSNSAGPYSYEGVSNRRRHYPRGTKRGRPRGSRGTGRGKLETPVSAPVVVSGDSVATSPVTSPIESPAVVKRGPGRPRLSPRPGPSNQGYRGRARGRRPQISMESTSKLGGKSTASPTPSSSIQMLSKASTPIRKVRFNLTPSILNNKSILTPSVKTKLLGNRSSTTILNSERSTKSVLNTVSLAMDGGIKDKCEPISTMKSFENTLSVGTKSSKMEAPPVPITPQSMADRLFDEVKSSATSNVFLNSSKGKITESRSSVPSSSGIKSLTSSLLDSPARKKPPVSASIGSPVVSAIPTGYMNSPEITSLPPIQLMSSLAPAPAQYANITGPSEEMLHEFLELFDARSKNIDSLF